MQVPAAIGDATDDYAPNPQTFRCDSWLFDTACSFGNKRSHTPASTGPAAARLAATVSHEINNPLEAIGNLIFLAGNNPDAPAKVAEQLELAEQELARVSHIARQTLGFYRESTSSTAVYIPTLIESVPQLYSNKLQMKQIRIQLAMEECPPITGLAGEIQQLVSNIISNAIDAVPINGTLKIDASPIKLGDGESIQLKVEDDGPGIAPENLRRIFEPFFTTKKDVGTGLGLWVSKEIAERHGGHVLAQSNSGNGSKGATFTVLLPCTQGLSSSADRTSSMTVESA